MYLKINNISSFIVRHCILALFILFVISAKSQDLPEKSNPPKLVNDFTNTLSVDEVNNLENKLVSYSDSTSTQIVILMVDDLLGYDKSDYAFKVAEKWGIGQKGSNNGILILIKPTGRQGERGAFIAVGYGLEPVITDALSRRIIENEMIPNFKENKFYDGIDKATDVLMKLAIGEFPAGYKNKGKAAKPLAAIIPFIIIIIVFLLMRIGGKKSFTGGQNTSFWTTLLLLSTMNNSHNSGSWGGFSSGGGSSGGFGGFGGGSFGGGGAGGSW